MTARVDGAGRAGERMRAGSRRANGWTHRAGSPKDDAKPMHAYANPTRFLAIAKPLTPWLLGVGVLLVLGGAFAGLTMVPGDY